MPELIGRDALGNFVFLDDEGNQRVVGRSAAGDLGVVDSTPGLSAMAAPPAAVSPLGIDADAGPTALPIEELALPGTAPEISQLAPSQMSSTKTTFTPAPPGAEGVLSELEGGQRQREQGVRDAMHAGVRKAAQEFGVMAEAEQQARQHAAKEAEEQQRHAARLEEVNQRMEAQADALAKSDVDPNRLFRNQDTGSQIAAGFAVGLGAVGAAMAGLKENPALVTIERAIERDIDAQKLDIEKKRASVSATASLYGQMMEQFRDSRVAREAARVLMYKATEMKLQKIAASTRSDEVRANAAQLLGQLREEGAKSKATVLQHMSDKFVIERDTKPQDFAKLRQSIVDEVRQNPQLKEYSEAREGLREFGLAMQTGNIGPGIISFVAKGMKQGSFGEKMEEILNRNGFADKTLDGLKKAFGHSANTKLAHDLFTFLRAKEISLRTELAPQFDRLDRDARRAGESDGLHSFFATGAPAGPGSGSGLPASAKRVK
jgi:hypothetical protein